MCGSTSAESTAQQQQAQFYSTLQSEYGTVFGEDQGILQNLTKQLTPIINAGPSQSGYSQGEVNALDTDAAENTSSGYAQARTALNQNLAAQGGGNDYLPSGGSAEIQGQLAGEAAATEANQQNTINLDNYGQGQTNYNNAISAEEGVATQLNPAGFAGQATSAGNASANTANQIAQNSNSIWGSVLSSLGGIAGKAVGSGGALGSIFNSAGGPDEQPQG